MGLLRSRSDGTAEQQLVQQEELSDEAAEQQQCCVQQEVSDEPAEQQLVQPNELLNSSQQVQTAEQQLGLLFSRSSAWSDEAAEQQLVQPNELLSSSQQVQHSMSDETAEQQLGLLFSRSFALSDEAAEQQLVHELLNSSQQVQRSRSDQTAEQQLVFDLGDQLRLLFSRHCLMKLLSSSWSDPTKKPKPNKEAKVHPEQRRRQRAAVARQARRA